MNHKITTAIVCLRISQVFYILIGVGVPMLMTLLDEDPIVVGIFSAVMGITTLSILVGLEVLIYGLKKRKKWSWIVGLIVFGLYIPSLFLPLGVIGMIAMMKPETQRVLGASIQTQPTPPTH